MTYLLSALVRLKSTVRNLSLSGLGAVIWPLILLVFIGTFSYSFLEGWSLLQALYATIITITTVGYGDLSPSTQRGQVFAIFFTVIAIGLAGYAISTLAAVVIENQQEKVKRKLLERRMKQIEKLENHNIVCGGSLLAHRTANEFVRRGVPVVIIEQDEAVLKQALLWMNQSYVQKRMRQFNLMEKVDWSDEEGMAVGQLAEEIGVHYLLEDPTDEMSLLRAGIERASGLAATMEDDRDNVSIVLSARDIVQKVANCKLRIVACAWETFNMRRIYLAGADKVVSPNFLGGFNVASQILDPHLADLWNDMLFQPDMNLRMLDIPMDDHPTYVGKTALQFKRGTENMIIAVRRDGEFVYTPDPDFVLETDDNLIVIGHT